MPPRQPCDSRLTGLSCASCVDRAQAAMAAVPGVTDAAVNLATGQATVAFAAPATPESIRAASAKAGYPAEMTDISLDVRGATCASCVLRIETALNAVPGVTETTMNLATSRARIATYAGSATRADLIRAVQSIGYSVDTTAPDTAQPRDRHAETAAAVRASLITAAILTLPVFTVEMGRATYSRRSTIWWPTPSACKPATSCNSSSPPSS